MSECLRRQGSRSFKGHISWPPGSGLCLAVEPSSSSRDPRLTSGLLRRSASWLPLWAHSRLAERRKRLTRELMFLGVTTAAGLGCVGVFFELRGRIPKVYLADAAVEAMLVAE